MLIQNFVHNSSNLLHIVIVISKPGKIQINNIMNEIIVSIQAEHTVPKKRSNL
jgi:hypothetical protein